MFSSLQDALNKLREAKQSVQSQPKRVAVAADNHTQTRPPQPPAGDMDDLDIDLGDPDLFDDLLVDDKVVAEEPPLLLPSKVLPTTADRPTATTTRFANATSDIGQSQMAQQTNIAESARRPGSTPATTQNNLSRFRYNSTPTGSSAASSQQRNAGLPPAGPSRQSSAMSQTDMLAVARTPDGRSGSRAAAQTKTITTTVVGNGGRRAPLLSRKRQTIPGPAGLLEETSTSVALTQKPVSPFKTPLSRRAEREQSSSVDFEGGTWAAMLDHLEMPTYTPSTAKTVTQTIEAAKWPIRRVLELLRTQRIQMMLVQLRDLGSSDTDASVVLVDPTGEMRASIHKPVIKRFIHFLAAGTSIILKDVVAVKVPGAQPFLVITAASIEQIFTSKGAGTHENPIVLSATQASIGTPTRAAVNQAASEERPDGNEVPAENTQAESLTNPRSSFPETVRQMANEDDGESSDSSEKISSKHDLPNDDEILDNEFADGFLDVLDPSQ
ncbi:hypothetical protein H4R20_004367 [Coemansia guatemalensis]|uniref:Homologous recombination OB-fold protein OB-fold domain-containing protein n=1 Tax=Coemansia guatemalensis TaxID=2761395 RepID=A0A9W8HUN0_9FUNG|nr:hypothetical protein H4R20_004367 [Coemansia guatemalensis]